MFVNKPILPFLETMVAYSCNLSCSGCTNYSDYNTKGLVSWEQGKEWLQQWLTRVNIPDFGIIGGEPLMHPQINQWIYGLRDLLPNSQIRFTTNGKLLPKKFNIVDQFLEIGNSVIKITVHQPDEFYIQEVINALFKRANWEPIIEHKIKRWIGPNNTRLQINFPQRFVKSYVGNFNNMMPHNSSPNEAFKICVQQTCPLLHNGKIFKCSSIALLNKVTTDWQRNNIPDWQPYLDYKGIDSNCSEIELQKFINMFGKPESICQMCPSESDTQSQVIHTSAVMTKTQWILNNHKKDCKI